MSESLRGLGDLIRRMDATTAPATRERLLRLLGTAAVAEAKRLVPRKTGNLGRTIRVDEVTDEHVTILAGGVGGVGYARDVEFGTGPHIIRPVKAKVLAWGGARRLSGSLRSGAKPENFAMLVHHPGSRAKPYLVPGAHEALRKTGLADVVVSAWNEAA